MALKNFAQANKLVLVHEGGFVDHPRDPGGATNKGITIATFRQFIDPKGTVDDLKRLTVEQAGKVYKAQYWDKVRGDELPSGLDYAVFDFCVNSGPGRAVKYLQMVAGVTADGQLGPKSMAAIERLNVRDAIHDLSDRRMAFLRNLPTWNTFGNGWKRRVEEVRMKALVMAGS